MENNNDKILLKTLNFNADYKIPQFEERESNRGFVYFGENNLYPEYLLSLTKRSARHSAILKTKARMIGGNGWDKNNLTPATINFIKNINGDFNLDEILARCAYDLELFNAFSLIITWSKDREKIARIEYINPSKVRIANPDPEKEVDSYFVSDGWENTKKYPPVLYPGFDMYNRQDAQQLLYVKIGEDSIDWYAKPSYIAAVNWIELDYELSMFHLSNVKKGFYPSLMINFNYEPSSEEEMDTVIRRLKYEYGGASNAGNVLFTFSEGKDNAPVITPIQSNDSDKKFEQLNTTLETNIFQAHQINNPALFGVLTPGKLGGTNELVESLAIFQSMYVDPRQFFIEGLFNKLAGLNGITDKLTIEKYNIKLEIKMSVGDILSVLQSSISNEQKIQVFESIGYTSEQAKSLVGNEIIAPTTTPIQNN
jgi:hypothetical protein